MNLELDKEEMQVILSMLLLNQVIVEAYEGVVFDLSQEWQIAPVIVKDTLPKYLNKLVVELVEGIKEYETQHE